MHFVGSLSPQTGTPLGRRHQAASRSLFIPSSFGPTLDQLIHGPKTPRVLSPSLSKASCFSEAFRVAWAQNPVRCSPHVPRVGPILSQLAQNSLAQNTTRGQSLRHRAGLRPISGMRSRASSRQRPPLNTIAKPIHTTPPRVRKLQRRERKWEFVERAESKRLAAGWQGTIPCIPRPTPRDFARTVANRRIVSPGCFERKQRRTMWPR